MSNIPEKYDLYINGEWVKPDSGEYFDSINPANEESMGKFAKGNEKDTEKAIKAANEAKEKWASYPAPKRGELLLKVAQILRERKDELGKLVTDEMGKQISEGKGDVQEAIDMFEYMAGEGRRLYGVTTPSELKDKFCMTVKKPIGVVGCITPWNFPIAIPAWKIAPALIAGNTVVFKPSSDTPKCAAKLVEILDEVGIPKGVVNLVYGSGSSVGKTIVTHDNIDGISFTGHRDTGKWITENAGLKKVGLEMGGKNPIIIMEDADLKLGVDGVLWGAFGTTGQRCTAASRVIVHEDVHDKFIDKLTKEVKSLKIGYGMENDVGPLVNKQAYDKVSEYSEIAKKEGTICYESKSPKKGFFHPLQIIVDINPNDRIAKEEIFGPILAVIKVKDLNEAIEVANNVEYGLSSSIYTQDVNNSFKAIEKIQSGLTYVNASTIGSEVHLPFGGVKNTGNGAREGGGPSGAIEEFTETKTVYVDYSGKLQKAQIDEPDVK